MRKGLLTCYGAMTTGTIIACIVSKLVFGDWFFEALVFPAMIIIICEIHFWLHKDDPIKYEEIWVVSLRDMDEDDETTMFHASSKAKALKFIQAQVGLNNICYSKDWHWAVYREFIDADPTEVLYDNYLEYYEPDGTLRTYEEE